MAGGWQVTRNARNPRTREKCGESVGVGENPQTMPRQLGQNTRLCPQWLWRPIPMSAKTNRAESQMSATLTTYPDVPSARPVPAAPVTVADCPFDGGLLHVPLPRWIVLQERARGEAATLTLYYGEKEAAFEEPELFGFARGIAGVSSFTVAEARRWSPDATPEQISACIETLLAEGVLARGPLLAEPIGPRARPSPLPEGAHGPGLSWSVDAERIGLALLGEPVHPAHLELVIPVFRVAHPALDADDRQVGEASVFPRPLRLDRPTEWQVCTYSGTRHLSERPMNVTALKAMRAHWPEMMAALSVIRAAYLRRCGLGDAPLTLGQIERLAVAVLSVPTWALVKPRGAVANGALDPSLSSLFRVTDGLRMAAHQMMFVPVGEPVTAPTTVVSAADLHDFAERAMSFHSETGVCAGPAQFVAEFLSVLIEGKAPVFGANGVIGPGMAAALADIEAAMDYGFEALAVHASAFSFWPVMGAAYESLGQIAEGLPKGLSPQIDDLREWLQASATQLVEETYLGRADWRRDRLAAYADMYLHARTAAGLPPRGLSDAVAQAVVAEPQTRAALNLALASAVPALPAEAKSAMTETLLTFALQAQALLRLACRDQARLAQRLDRPMAPGFAVRDLSLHTRLQGDTETRLPFLTDALAELLGLRLSITPDRVTVEHVPRHQTSPSEQRRTTAQSCA